MSIENITSAILDEGKAEKEQIINAAKTKSRGVIRELEERIEIETDVAVKEAEDESERIINRRRSVADIDSKKIILTKKQELISQCFDKTIEYILNMDRDDYVRFLAEAGRNTGVTQGELIFNAKERNSIGEDVVKALSAAVPRGEFKLSGETRGHRGGYLLRRGQIYINISVEALVDEMRQELTGQVAAILFPKQD